MSRRFQFSLSGLFGLLVIVSLPCGVVAYFSHQLNEFHRAAEPIEKVAGRRIRAGGDGMGMLQGSRGIIYVNLTGPEIDDEVLASLLPDRKRLPNLRLISLSRSGKVTVEGVERLQKELPDCHIDWL